MTTETIWLIVGCFFAGFIDAIAGGGGLISVPLLLTLGLPPKMAIGTNKLIGVAAASSSTLRYTLSGHVPWKKIGFAILGGLLGGAGGAFSLSLLDNSFLAPLIIVGLVGASLLSLKKNYFLDQGIEKHLSHTTYFIIGLCLGFYDGFFGPGTGSFLMIVFISFAGMSVLKASASARVINLASNFAALCLFFTKGLVDVRFALIGMTCSALGAVVGANLSISKGAKLIRPVYLLVVWSMILKLIFQTFAA